MRGTGCTQSSCFSGSFQGSEQSWNQSYVSEITSFQNMQKLSSVWKGLKIGLNVFINSWELTIAQSDPCTDLTLLLSHRFLSYLTFWEPTSACTSHIFTAWASHTFGSHTPSQCPSPSGFPTLFYPQPPTPLELPNLSRGSLLIPFIRDSGMPL